MKLKSETKQVITFLQVRFDVSNQDKTVLEICKQLNLNYDMLCRGLQQLHVKHVISRDSRGPKSAYQYPTQIGMGDVVEAIQGIDLGTYSNVAKNLLNSVKL